MKHHAGLAAPPVRLRQAVPLLALGVLLIAVFAAGGGARDDIVSLIVLRPLAAVCLGIGLATLSREHWLAFRLPLGFMAAILALIGLHLVPLPPFVWTALPGRELAIAAAEAAGIEQPWRPLTLVPYRGWNAFYAMIVPAAVMVLAVQVPREDHRRIVLLVLGAAVLSALWAIIQSVSGYAPWSYWHAVTNRGTVTGLFSNRNHLAAMLVASLPLLALVASRARGGRAGAVQVACGGLAALFVMITLATGSRAGTGLAVLAMVAAIPVWRARPQRPADRRRSAAATKWVGYAIGAFAAAMLAAFAVLLARSTGFERLAGTGSGPVEEYRFLVWETILRFLPQYLPLGSGIGSFVEVFKIHEPGAMLGTNYWNHAHNDWLEWALEGGLPAIALMLAGVAAYALRTASLLRQARTGRYEVQLGLAGAVVLLGLGLWSGVDYPLRTPALASIAALSAVWMALAAAPRGGEAPGFGDKPAGRSGGWGSTGRGTRSA
ncbi:O-antigen ligase [Erythrobacter sp. HL-111]|uniref:O-antigen ligase family protein n=1 Tax=Erythrobacter sp. HL-111 TaxID=1798193 RepID=UPI0006DB2861|nr:O-antigen ligase family protein [Erythrobacter sp. HL-111]KPP95485.1 MAG: O-antigen ligase family protein [Erythrobacteraceae bacterium HL-111]SDS72825.1 O-antigen ligase like membrane protein [Erythrobacter sp. HL-111]